MMCDSPNCVCENIRTAFGSTAQSDLQRDRDLLLDLLGRVSRKQRDDGDLHVGDVRERLDRQRSERGDARRDEQDEEQTDEQRLVEGDGKRSGGSSRWRVRFELPQQQDAVPDDMVAGARAPRTMRTRPDRLGTVSTGRRTKSCAPLCT